MRDKRRLAKKPAILQDKIWIENEMTKHFKRIKYESHPSGKYWRRSIFETPFGIYQVYLQEYVRTRRVDYINICNDHGEKLSTLNIKVLRRVIEKWINDKIGS